MNIQQTVIVNRSVDVAQVEAMFGFDPCGRIGTVIEHCHGTGEKDDPNVFYVAFGDDDFAVLFDFELEVA
jgi:hypothetical protein